MKRFTILLSIFFIALSLPLAYFILLAYRSVQQEEKAELQYFTKILFDEMEEELTALILREEQRAVDEYNYYLAPDAVQIFPSGESALTGSEEEQYWISLPQEKQKEGLPRSPLADLPDETYILGYLQNNPDGSFQSPLIESGKTISDDRREVTVHLEEINTFLNSQDRSTFSDQSEEQRSSLASLSQQDEVLDQNEGLKQEQALRKTEELEQEEVSKFAEKYLDLPQSRGQKISPKETQQSVPRTTRDQISNVLQAPLSLTKEVSATSPPPEVENVQVKVSPMESAIINDQEILIFRRIVINGQEFRQGFVVLAEEFLHHLKDTYFLGQPMAEFTTLRLEILEQAQTITRVQTGDVAKKPVVTLTRTFSRPFSFLRATITGNRLPASSERWILNAMRVVIGTIILVGLLTIYQSGRTMVELSERRAMFVSSVTHELKTPLTTLRMYSEMLEEGIAPTREREQEYFRILRSESERLSRLIENVLEFSKLERKQRRFEIQEGDFDDVIRELRDIIGTKLRQEGFVLHVERHDISTFRYDREVMVQVLLNLIENSIKFGKGSPVREITLSISSEGKQIHISVSDTGPGIPCADLKKIFDDFYRGEHEVTQTIRGTGIGLALVKRYITALGGTVNASNNKASGCTITISLPA